MRMSNLEDIIVRKSESIYFPRNHFKIESETLIYEEKFILFKKMQRDYCNSTGFRLIIKRDYSQIIILIGGIAMSLIGKRN